MWIICRLWINLWIKLSCYKNEVVDNFYPVDKFTGVQVVDNLWAECG